MGGTWNDVAQAGATFPGLAQLAGLHHICVKMTQLAGAVPNASAPVTTAAALPIIGTKERVLGTAWKATDLVLDAVRMEVVLSQALRLVRGPAPPCTGDPEGMAAVAEALPLPAMSSGQAPIPTIDDVVVQAQHSLPEVQREYKPG